MLPRSGLALKHGITCLNAPGLIDPQYRGELKVLLVNTDPAEPFTVERGDRIAQLVIQQRRAGRLEGGRRARHHRSRRVRIRFHRRPVTKPFRFGVTAGNLTTGSAWAEQARRIEGLGYSTLFVHDHFVDSGAPAPMVALVVRGGRDHARCASACW